MLALVSRVTSPPEASSPLGSFHLNLSGVVGGSAASLYQAICDVAPLVVGVPLAIDLLNDRSFVPHKDYTTNRLVAGVLQLAPSTMLLVDETAMASGQVSQVGVANLFAFATIMDRAALEYDFGSSQGLAYDNITVAMDTPVVVFSEGTSMFASSKKQAFGNLSRLLELPLEPAAPSSTSSAPAPTVDHATAMLIRRFLAAVRWAPYTFDDSLSDAISDEFTTLRTDPTLNMDPQRLSLWLTLARWHALLHGKSSLDMDSWAAVKDMERARLARVAARAAAAAASS